MENYSVVEEYLELVFKSYIHWYFIKCSRLENPENKHLSGIMTQLQDTINTINRAQAGALSASDLFRKMPQGLTWPR